MAFLEIGNGWQSPRISFSVDLSQIDRTSPEKRKREGAADINYSTEFEFCSVNSFNVSSKAELSETLMSADELFMDGKILPQIRAPEAQPLTIARHLSVESSRCSSPVRSVSHPTSGAGNDDFKSARKSSGRWKEVFRKDYFCAAVKEPDQDAKESGNDVKRRSRWPFSRSSGERRANGLFCALPFSRSKSAVERKCKPCCDDASCYRSKSVGAESVFQENESLLVSGSNPGNTGGLKCEDVKLAAKGAPDLAKRKGSTGRKMRSSPARNYGGGSRGRFRVRNSKAMDFPRRGRPMAEVSLKSNCNNISGTGISLRVSPVLNVPDLGTGSVGVRKNGRGLFGLVALFSSKRYSPPQHHGRCPTSRMKGA